MGSLCFMELISLWERIEIRHFAFKHRALICYFYVRHVHVIKRLAIMHQLTPVVVFGLSAAALSKGTF